MGVAIDTLRSFLCPPDEWGSQDSGCEGLDVGWQVVVGVEVLLEHAQ